MGEKIIVNELHRSHPKHTTYHIYKTVEPEPIPEMELEIARWCSSGSIRFEVWDSSRPSEEPYYRKSYLWVTSTKIKSEVDKLKKEMLSIERVYQSKIKKFRIQVEESTKEAEKETREFIERL